MENFEKTTKEFEIFFFEKEFERIKNGKNPSPTLLRVQFLREKAFISHLLKKATSPFIVWKLLMEGKHFSGTYPTFLKHLKKHNLSKNDIVAALLKEQQLEQK